MKDCSELERVLGVRFRDRRLLEEALTHRSFSNENPSDSAADNERLEFLGDSVLGLVVSDALLGAHPEFNEGSLSRARAFLVSAPNLVRYAHRIGLGAYLRIGHGEERSGGRTKPALLVDALEAVVGALYLDGGFDRVRRVVQGLISEDLINLSLSRLKSVDSKSVLQEVLQKMKNAHIQYEVVEEAGPDHQKSFRVEARVNGEVLATGMGLSRKAAEQAAALRALELLEDGESGVWGA